MESQPYLVNMRTRTFDIPVTIFDVHYYVALTNVYMIVSLQKTNYLIKLLDS